MSQMSEVYASCNCSRVENKDRLTPKALDRRNVTSSRVTDVAIGW